MWPLRERVVVVTGASSGIGRATALAAARAGAQVAITARRENRLHVLAAEIRRLGAVAHVFPLDLADHAAATYLIGAVVVRTGRIDVLVNNAGYGLRSRLEDAHPDDMERLFAVNALTPLAAMRAAIPTMRRQREGHIVNVASVAAAYGLPGMGLYNATKAALLRATEAARVELRGSGVYVSAICPGPVATEFDAVAQVRGDDPMGGFDRRRGTPVTAERVADEIMRCVRRDASRTVVLPRVGLAAFLAPLLPAAAVDAIVWRLWR